MARAIVYHARYGCDTGCCGHYVELDGKRNFVFDHPYNDESTLSFVKTLVTSSFGEQHVADIDWDNCVVIDD